MKPQTIRKIDLYLGKPLCLVLTVHSRIFSRRRRSPRPPEEIKQILFIKFIEQGATVLAYQALREAIERYGKEQVFFAVFEENREILDILGILPARNIISLRSGKPIGFLLDWIRALRRIRSLPIDATVDLEFFTRAPAVFAYMTRAPVRVGLHRYTSEIPYRGDLMTHRVQYNPYLHITELYAGLGRALQSDPAETPLLKETLALRSSRAPRLRPRKDEVQKVQDALTALNGGEVTGPIVLLNPNASDMLPLRKWPSERFIDLGKKILKQHPAVTLVITGAPSERAAAEKIARAIGKKAVSMAGKTTLRELIVLYSLADVLVTNDSGPAHFSTLTDIDAIVLFGPETPKLYGARRQKTHVLWAGLACSPCVNVFNHRFSPCTNNRCMQVISVREVYEVVAGCL